MDAEMPVEAERLARCTTVGPALRDRELLSPGDAFELARIFKLLANDTRLRLLHALERAGKLSVQKLAVAIDMTPQAVSNQLQRLVDRQVLAARRDGHSVYYRIIDPCLPVLLDLGLCLADGPNESKDRAR
jgi:ArsR family transcriptional regulator, lead/cadmium/zinc/bismuth-responsive transcriptional repressor